MHHAEFMFTLTCSYTDIFKKKKKKKTVGFLKGFFWHSSTDMKRPSGELYQVISVLTSCVTTHCFCVCTQPP